MATESPIRITEASRKWVSRNEMPAFGTPSINMGMEDPGLVLKGQSGQARKMTLAPNRSGSAPPSMEGSFAAIENLMFRHKMAATAGLASPNTARATDMCEPEEQLRADPSYFAYYWAHVNLNPRLPPPLISDENRHLFLGSTGSNRRLASFDDSSNGSFRLTPSSLSTHKEESNNDRSPKQEDCSQAPSPVHNESRPYNHECVAEADNRGGDDMWQPPYSAPITATVSSTSLLDGRGGSVPIKPSVDRSSASRLEDDVRSESRRIQIDRQQRSVFQAHGSHPQMVSQGQAYTGVHFLNRLSDFASELEHGLQSSGFTQPPYGSGAPYVMPENHVYASMIPSGYFSQQYTVGGYAFNPAPLSPYVTGYLPTSPVPMPFDINLQHPSKFYGHLGLPVRPSLAESFQLSGHGDDPIQKQPHLRMAGHANLNSRTVDTMSPYYLSNPTNMGALQFPPMPGSPMGGTGASFAGGRWQAQHPGFKDPKTYSFLEDLKSGKGRRFELSDISGHIVEFCADQHGSRFIQQKLEACSVEEKESVFNEVLPEASGLIIDVFGNYVIQKFFEYGTAEHRRQLANRLEGQILPLSLQMYGCRVIQKALDAIEVEQKVKLVRELDGHVLRCVRDQNGNHVIQKCIESIPTEKIKFVISSFRGHVAALSTHPYGCRVIQRVLEHSTDELQSQFIVDEILESAYSLAQDQYGNYVTQHVLERGKPEERSEIVHKLAGRIVQLSQHKFASNVIEKCLEYGDPAARRIVVEEIVGVGDSSDNLLAMVKDQFANYVIQKVLQTCTGDQREMLLGRIKVHLNSLKKYTYGKHIVARFEQLYGEEIQASGP